MLKRRFALNSNFNNNIKSNFDSNLKSNFDSKFSQLFGQTGINTGTIKGNFAFEMSNAGIVKR